MLSILLFDLEEDAEDVESYLSSGGEPTEEIERSRANWGCRRRFGRAE